MKFRPLLFFHAAVIASAALFVAAAAPSFAADTMEKPAKAAKVHKLHYLSPGEPDTVALLAPPPLLNSAEQAADLAETIAVHNQHSTADDAAAKTEQNFSVFAFAPAIGPIFQPGKLPITEAFLKHVLDDSETVTDNAKNYWKRPRPYATDPALARGANDLEKSFSYPSGHSTRGTVFALVLAELFPDKQEAILATGRNIGWHRVELGRHYPTDIYAGRVLAQAIVRDMKMNAHFQRDLAEAKNEITAALSGGKQTQEPAAAGGH